MALADAYEEWTAAIDPKRRLTHRQAMDAIVRSASHRFDPIIVDAFVVLHEAFDRIRRELAEPDQGLAVGCRRIRNISLAVRK